MPPLPVSNKRSEFLTRFKVVNIAAAEPTGTQPDTAYSAGIRLLDISLNLFSRISFSTIANST